MKRIDELTEQEILALTSEDIALMIKLAKANEGIKFMIAPVEPVYDKIPEPNLITYSCNELGDKFSFTNIDELNSLVKTLQSLKTLCAVTYNWQFDGKAKYVEHNKPLTNIETASSKTYTKEEYDKIKEILANNKKLEKDYQDALKEYRSNEEIGKDIVNEITNKVAEVTNKYFKFNFHYDLLVDEYLPLANQDYFTAMKFLDKAYSLSDNEKIYIANKFNSEIREDKTKAFKE